MEQKQKVFKWLSVGFLSVGFLVYVVYLFCRKPSGLSGTEYSHIGWFIVDVFMIGGSLLGLLMPDKFRKVGGFCIVGLSFANLVMSAVEGTGSIFSVNNPNITNAFPLWVEFFAGLVSMIAIACIVVSLAAPKTAKILGPIAAIAFVISGLLLLAKGIDVFVDPNQKWAYGINDIAVSLIILGLAFGLAVYAFLIKPGFGEKKTTPNASEQSESKTKKTVE